MSIMKCTSARWIAVPNTMVSRGGSGSDSYGTTKKKSPRVRGLSDPSRGSVPAWTSTASATPSPSESTYHDASLAPGPPSCSTPIGPASSGQPGSDVPAS
ncbi:MAG: hypothetical protein M5U28_37550 [Sandaracinaceae bacterium]|nr:hypothetical protein [Sandaracinaceae bacterium]